MCTSSIMHMCIISLDRFKCIRDPLSIRHRSKWSVAARILAVWAFAISISSPLAVLAIFRPADILNSKPLCIISNPNFLVYGSIAAFFLPLMVMLITYSLTIKLLRQKASEIENSGGLRRSLSRKKLQGREKWPLKASRNDVEREESSYRNSDFGSSFKNSCKLDNLHKTPSPCNKSFDDKLPSNNFQASICYYQVKRKPPKVLTEHLLRHHGNLKKRSKVEGKEGRQDKGASTSQSQQHAYHSNSSNSNNTTPLNNNNNNTTKNNKMHVYGSDFRANTSGIQQSTKATNNGDGQTVDIIDNVTASFEVNSEERHKRNDNDKSILAGRKSQSSEHTLLLHYDAERPVRLAGTLQHGRAREGNSSATIAPVTKKTAIKKNLLVTLKHPTTCTTKHPTTSTFSSTTSSHELQPQGIQPNNGQKGSIEFSKNKDFASNKSGIKSSKLTKSNSASTRVESDQITRDALKTRSKSEHKKITDITKTENSSKAATQALKGPFKLQRQNNFEEEKCDSADELKDKSDEKDISKMMLQHPHVFQHRNSLKDLLRQQQKSLQHLIHKYQFKSSLSSLTDASSNDDFTKPSRDHSSPASKRDANNSALGNLNSTCHSNFGPKIKVCYFSEPLSKSLCTNEHVTPPAVGKKSEKHLQVASRGVFSRSLSSEKSLWHQVSFRGVRRDNNKTTTPTSVHSCTSKSVTNERKAVKVLGLMFAMFVFCWLAFFCVNFAMGVCPECNIDESFFKYVLWLGYTSSLINPIIYTVFNLSFRKAFIRILTCQNCFQFCKRKRKNNQLFLKYN